MRNIWFKILLLVLLVLLVFLFAEGAGLETSVLHSLENIDNQEDNQWLNQYEINPNSINQFTLENPGDIVGKDIIIIEE